MIRAILACDSRGGIGKDGALPWPHNRKDLAHFQKLTSGCTVVMGRGTWEGKGMPKPLPNRHNVVVTSNPDYLAPGADVISEDILEHLSLLAKSNTVFVIGGSVLINQFMDDIHFFHLTRISGAYNCDVFINLDELEEKFVKIDSVKIDDSTQFETYISRTLHDIPFTTEL